MYKKIISVLVVFMMLSPLASFAQTLPGDTDPGTVSTFQHNLHYGMRNNVEVSNLQEFLTDQGFYSNTITGNFFILTRAAVKKFQQQHGINSTGYFGPLSRGVANKILTNGGKPEGFGNLYINPSEAQLKVGESVEIKPLLSPICPLGQACVAMPEQVEVSFLRSENSKVAEVERIVPDCAVPPPGVQSHCSYSPVYLVRGVSPGSTFITVTYTPHLHAYTAKMKVVVTSSGSGNLSPVISSIKGPTTLKIGETGTWTIVASDPENKSLKYSVRWGDELTRTQALDASVSSPTTNVNQTATFTHTYVTARTFEPTFVVTDETGLYNYISASVNVGGVTASRGSLALSPDAASLYVGNSVGVKAIYTPPRPACLDSVPRCMIAERAPYEVAASFVSDNSKIAAIDLAMMSCDPIPASSSYPPTCPSPITNVRGVSSGSTMVTATYMDGGTTYTAKMSVSVR